MSAQWMKRIWWIAVAVTLLWPLVGLAVRNAMAEELPKTEVHPFQFGIASGVPAPTIPKSWRLVGVVPGPRPDITNLWFEDSDGAIWMIQTLVKNITAEVMFKMLKPGEAAVSTDVYKINRR